MKSHVTLNCRALKARASRKVCEEKLACRSQYPALSKYYCTGCRSYQCELCETLLHEEPRFVSHERIHVSITSDDVLCDGNCIERNFADVNCVTCKRKFCVICDRVVHSSKSIKNRKVHIRTKFETEEFLSCDEGLSIEDNQELNYSNETMFSMEFVEELPNVLEKDTNASMYENFSEASSFLLINDKEQLQVRTAEEFAARLRCGSNKLFKVISIFGNTGDGKSYTFNHTFYDGKEIFPTSSAQVSCTVGVWAAQCSDLDLITIDTEGFLGQASNPNQRARMLLKILAISDIVVYRTRAERLHSDMFKFLGDASVAYSKHFSQELEEASNRCNIEGPLSVLGPAVIIFHETLNTDVLLEDAEAYLRGRFQQMGLRLDAFSHLEYVGTRTNSNPTDFEAFRQAVLRHTTNSAVRIARSPEVIFKVLKVLNDKFSGSLEKALPNTFPDQYFTCSTLCLSCKCRCTNSMNHTKDELPHISSDDCIYQYQFDNRIFLCKACFERGEKVVVAPKTVESNESSWLGFAKYAWAGYLLECSKCGVIYRSRQYWYGNKDPWETCVRTEICHVWPEEPGSNIVNQHTARYVIDKLNSVSEVVCNVGATPTKMLSSWMADQIAPAYWVPNSQLSQCTQCLKEFGQSEKKHHCRACGGGFCETCSSNSKVIPGWGSSGVRVCDKCYKSDDADTQETLQQQEVTARKIGEVVHSTLGTVASAVNYSFGIIKETARPTYWVPDAFITQCCVCEKEFSPKLTIHHCRSCGEGVCDGCSSSRRSVPSRHWTYDVRVCDTCNKQAEL